VTARYPWARVVLVLCAIAGVLAAPIVIIHRTSERAKAEKQRIADEHVAPFPTMTVDPQSFYNYFRSHASVVGPVSLGDAVTLTGGPGFQAQFVAVQGNDAGTVSYLIHVRNAGTRSFDGSLKIGVWLATADGGRLSPSKVRIPGLWIWSKSMIAPGHGTDRVVDFSVPAGAQPARLEITIELGDYVPTATWNVGPGPPR
jgi:hypothetical protein